MSSAVNSPTSASSPFSRSFSKKLPLIPTRRHSQTTNNSNGDLSPPSNRLNPHLEPGGDTDSPTAASFDSSPSSNRSNRSLDTPSRSNITDKVSLFKRLSSELSRPFNGRKNNDELSSSIPLVGTPKSETVYSSSTISTARDSNNKDQETSPSRYFAFRRNRKQSLNFDGTENQQHTVKVAMIESITTSSTISSSVNGSEMESYRRSPDKHACTSSTPTDIINNVINKQVEEGHLNKERSSKQKSGGKQKLPALVLIPQTTTAGAQEQATQRDQPASSHRRHRDRHSRRSSRRRSTDSACVSQCSSSYSSGTRDKGSSRRRRSSTGRSTTGRDDQGNSTHHNSSNDITGLGLPPLQSPSPRRVSTHSSTSARSVERPPHHHQQRRRRNSETSDPKALPLSPDSHRQHRRHHHERGCSTERVERRYGDPDTHRSSRRQPVLKGSPEELQEQLRSSQQQAPPPLPSPPSTSRRRRWSLSSRHGDCEGDPGHETGRGLRRLAGSTIGRRNSTTATTQGSTLTSPSHRKFTPSLGWLISFRGFNRANNMGAALGNCCAGRDDEVVKQKAKEKYEKTWDFLQGEQVLSDVDKFDKAYAANDIKGFVDLLNSAEPIEELPEKMHPWAADPKTVGALSTTQLAILAAKEDDPTIKDRIRDSGAIPILVKNLNSKEDDRLHASVVALSFLSVDNPRNCIEIFESGAMAMLIKGMETDIEGLRGATAQTCRNIYVLDLKYRADFKKHGGVQALVKLLDLPQGEVDPENLFNQLEAVYHLEDLILEAGEELPEYVSEVKKAGAVRRLEALIKVDNQDLTEAAQYLLVRLAD